MVARLILLAAFSACLAAADENLLARVRKQVFSNLERLPDYTCLQSIDRTVRKLPLPADVDRLRFEVAYVGGRELLSWPGERKFLERRLEEMSKRNGAMAFGDFAIHVRRLFGAADAVFSGPVAELRNYSEVLRWNFRIPEGPNGLPVGSVKEMARVPYHGSIWVDPKTLDLLRLEQSADQVPSRTTILKAGGAIEYARSPIGGASFLLPVFSELTMIDQNGYEYRNHAQFSACHQFVGESSITFADPAPAAAAAQAAVLRPVALGAGLAAELAMETEMDLSSAAIGDPVRAVLTHPLRSGEEIVYPEGAKLEGRITRLHRRTLSGGRNGTPYYIVGLRFSTLTGGEEARSKFQASLGAILPAGKVFYLPFAANPPRGFGKWERVSRLIPPAESGEGVFLAIGDSPRLSPDLRFQWRTLPER
jgi:hypothetical protein